MGDLERDTELSGSEGEYTAELSRDWEIWGPNGGYVASVALRAAGKLAAIPRPVSFYCHFVRTPRFGPVTLSAEVVQQGRRAESIRVSMFEGGKPVLEGLLRTAALADGLVHDVARVTDVPDPESLPRLEDLLPAPRMSFWKNVESRVIDRDRAVVGERPPSPPRLREWHRFRPRAVFDDPFVDAARSLILLDTFGWPAAWMNHPGSPFIAPSLDVSAFFHRPATHSEWLFADHTSPVAADGLVAAHGRVHDRQGTLLASGGAQLLCVAAST